MKKIRLIYQKSKETFMLAKYVLYKSLLRILAVMFILWGFYQAYNIVSSQTVEVRGGFVVQYFFSRIGYLPLPSLIFFALIFGALEYFAGGLLLFGLSSLQVDVAYWTLQLTLWLLGIALWYQQAFLLGSGIYDNLVPFDLKLTSLWPWIVLSLICSLTLFILYVPVVRLLKWLFESIKTVHVE
jgi:hypothetical protein